MAKLADIERGQCDRCGGPGERLAKRVGPGWRALSVGAAMPRMRGVGAAGSGAALMARRSVSRLAARPRAASSRAPRAPRVGRDHRRHPLGEGTPLARWGAAIGAPELKVQADREPLPGQVGEPPTLRLCRCRDGWPQSGQGAVSPRVVTTTVIHSASATRASRCRASAAVRRVALCIGGLRGMPQAAGLSGV